MRSTPAVSTRVALLLASLFAHARADQACDLEEYYSGFDGDISSWEREDLARLIRETHTSSVPFFGSHAGEGDVLEALMRLDPGSNDEFIHLFYLDQDAYKYPLDRSTWVPEHIRPVMMSSSLWSSTPETFESAFSDLHNIHPTHPELHESYRGTQYFGECQPGLCSSSISACACGEYFQPPPQVRGMVARALLYMHLRYEELELSNCHLEQLLAWHDSSPPTDEEITRNEQVCEEFQGNRNPYVDFPQAAFEVSLNEADCDLPIRNKEEEDGHVFDHLIGDPISPDRGDEDVVDSPCSEQSITHRAGCGDPPDDVVVVEDNDDDPPVGNIFDNVNMKPGGDGTIDTCSDLLPGDLYFFVVQSVPTRIAMVPLIDLPEGLELYLTDRLTVPSSVGRVVDDLEDSVPLMRLTLSHTMAAGNPFGFGTNLVMGDEWEVMTKALELRGGSFGGDELFLYCLASNTDGGQISNPHWLTAMSTHGTFFRDSGILGEVDSTTRKYGMVVLSEPQDYYVYNGPYYSGNDDYQRSLMEPTNWLGFDLTSVDDDSPPVGGGNTDDDADTGPSSGRVCRWDLMSISLLSLWVAVPLLV